MLSRQIKTMADRVHFHIHACAHESLLQGWQHFRHAINVLSWDEAGHQVCVEVPSPGTYIYSFERQDNTAKEVSDRGSTQRAGGHHLLNVGTHADVAHVRAMSTGKGVIRVNRKVRTQTALRQGGFLCLQLMGRHSRLVTIAVATRAIRFLRWQDRVSRDNALCSWWWRSNCSWGRTNASRGRTV